MNIKQFDILQYLAGHEGFISPTVIGVTVGGRPYSSASGWASSTLKRMQTKNWVLRNKRGHWALSGKGRMALINEM